MGSAMSLFTRNLVAQEMRERVAAAKLRGEPLFIPSNAAEIAYAYPGSVLTGDDLRNRLFAEAVWAGVDVDLGKRPPH